MHERAGRDKLIGRDPELELLRDAVAAVRGGATRSIGVFGEPGIGKTALLRELSASAATSGLLVLSGSAAEHERDLAFGLAVDALDDHVSTLHPRQLQTLGPVREAELAAVLPAVAQHVEATEPASGAERFRYHRALRALLERLGRERPLVLVLDDVHWADDASLELILHLIRRPPRGAHLLVFAGRRVGPALRLLDALRGAPCGEHVELRPLADADAAVLLHDVGDEALRARLLREAAGNPLYLEELALAAGRAEASLPSSLVAAVQQEVAALPAPARVLLEGAAVAGEPFDPELAARAAGQAEDALALLDQLVAADLVHRAESARGFRFRHPLARRAVYDAAPPAWRLAAHERVAEELTRRGAALAVRAYHVEQCARPGDDDAVALLTRAAAESAETAPATAARLYESAQRLLPGGDAARHAAVLAPRAAALASAGHLNESREAFERAAELLAPGAPERIMLVARCATLENVLGLHGAARGRLERALASLPDGAAAELRAALETQLALTAFFAADAAAVTRWAGRALQTTAQPPSGSPLAGAMVLGNALQSLGLLLSGDPTRSRWHVDLALRGFTRLPDHAVATWPESAWVLGHTLLLLERHGESQEVMRRGLRIARAERIGHLVAPLTTLLALGLTDTLDLAESLQLAEAAEETARLQGLSYQLQWALSSHSFVAWLQGDVREVARLEAECRPLLDDLEPGDIFKPIGRCNLAAHRAEEDPALALREMVDAAGPELERIDPTRSLWLALVLVRAAIATGDVDEARRFAALTERRAITYELPVGVTRALAARAEIALAEGDPQRAVRLAQAAADEQERLGARLDALPSRLCAGRALATAGRRAEAHDELQRVADEAGRAQAWRLRDAAGSELRRLGVRLAPVGAARAAPAPSALTPLTEREREIAALVAQGRSNKQVAATLFLSEKTVEHHLSRAYSKLGVRSRTQLTAAWGAAGRDASLRPA
ncbi:MAG TPA: AAA family ATPase [Solirubrobacteraceae bacterium]|nr:AAA family ATPase [Solirubrobacteraceae bacterium]